MLRLTWADFDFAVGVLAAMMPAGATGLLPIPRGGLILATALSHRTGLPVVASASMPAAGLVLVDDIADSGVTLDRWRQVLGPVPCLAWCRRETCAEPAHAAITLTNADWVVFPWERQDTAAASADLEAYRARHQ